MSKDNKTYTPTHHRQTCPSFLSTLCFECEKPLKMSGCLIDSWFTNWFPSLTDEEDFTLIAIGHLRVLSVFP